MKIALVGAGGYAETYLAHFKQSEKRWEELLAVIDPYAKSSSYHELLQRKQIPIFDTLSDFFRVHEADLVIISSPIPYHEEQVELALLNGAHVLCEKPLVPTIQQATKLELIRQRMQLQCGVGFQWSFSPVMQGVKARIQQGDFGRPLCFKVHMAWPRDNAYYTSSQWKGRIRDNNNRWVLDSIVSNAGAHYLHNLFYLLGETPNTSKLPTHIEGSLYRGRDIESFDSCFIAGEFENECKFYYFATHVSDAEQTPRFLLQFEHASISMSGNNADILLQWKDGRLEHFPNPAKDGKDCTKLLRMQQSIVDQTRPDCDIETIMPHLIVFNAMFDHMPIHNFPQALIQQTSKPASVYVKNIFEDSAECFDKEMLPDQLGFAWAKPSIKVSLSGIKAFQGRLL